MSGRLLQLTAFAAAMLLAIWLLIVLAVAHTYGVPLTDARGAFYLWWSFWVPFHLLAAAFLAGRLMSRSFSDRNSSSDRSR